MNYENIPSELREEKAWVNVWNGSKIPMKSWEYRAASSREPDTWSSYEDAEHGVTSGAYDGIGYVFHDTGLIGIDIDAGFDDGLLTGIAVDIMAQCASYTEKSRSGRGIHILVKGDLLFNGKNNRNGVEIYKTARYFIMTGDVLIFKEIIENQPAIDYILKNYFKDVEKESSEGSSAGRIYSPVYRKPRLGKIPLRPIYPEILPGSRNICLTSLAGQLHNMGYSKSEIYKELLHVNSEACRPPLPTSEVEAVVNSITRYRR